jgi:predicted permease
MAARIRSLARALFRRRRFEAAMADEIRFHMEAFAEDLIRSGVPREEAARRARLEFGGVESVKEQCRQARGLRLLDELRQDLRFAVRAMLKAPVVSTAAIVSLGLGIGANTALFGLVDAVFLRTVPVQNPGELYYFAHHAGPEASSNYPLFERYRALDAFSGVTAYWIGTFRVVTPEAVEPVTGQFVSGNYHAVLGVPLALGRGLSIESDRDTARSPIAVISDAYWSRQFGRSPSAIGSTLNINGRMFEIVGVTRPGFHGLDSDSRVDITVPVSVIALDQPGFFDDHGTWMSLRLVGRLKAGTPPAQALAAADVAFRQYMSEPEQQWALGMPGSDRFRSAALLPAGRGSDGRRDRTATPIRLLMAMAGVVLLIACANVANLLLARGVSRRREVAVRVSIGASRLRLIRQLLSEGLLLALCGGVLGLIVAVWMPRAILSLFEAGPTPLLLDVTMNARMLGFTFAVAAMTGIGFTLLPAIRATRVDPVPALKAAGALAHVQTRMTGGRLLVASQVALCVLLLVSAGLLGRSVRNLRTFDAGFDRERILLANVDTVGTEFSPERRTVLYASLLDRLGGLPGARSVSLSERTPIDTSSRFQRIEVPGFVAQGRHGVSTNAVAPEYFRTFGIRVVRGRGFTLDDRADAPPVAVVSEAMARFYFGDSNPIGRTVIREQNTLTIVGVVEDVRHERLTVDEPSRMVYTALTQTAALLNFDGGSAVPARVTIAVRAGADPIALAGTVRDHVRRIDRRAMVSNVRTFDEQLDAAIARERLLATLSTAFGAFALALACVGLYGTLSYRVVQRSREIGVRMALGAARLTVLRQVLREGLTVASAGVVVGGLAAFWTTRVIAAFLFEVSPHDPLTMGAVVAILLVTALFAGFFPARRAATVEPARILRAE